MDFNFTEEQSMVRDTVASFLQDKYDFETRRKIVASDAGWRADYWKAFAEELGILGAPFSEELGGLGGGAIDNMIIMEEFGKALVIEPYLGSVVIGGGFMKHSGYAHAASVIEGIVGGTTTIAFAYAEPQGRYTWRDLKTTAKKEGSGYVLNGHKAVVVGAPFASHLIVTARTGGAQRDAGGVSVFLIDKSLPGIVTRDYPTVDGGRASEVYFENVSIPADALIGGEGESCRWWTRSSTRPPPPSAPRRSACCASCTRARWTTPASANNSAPPSPTSRCCNTGWSTCSSMSNRRCR
jgi:alkylation response protein AidB-like acyl-CoA dehydrogenase